MSSLHAEIKVLLSGKYKPEDFIISIGESNRKISIPIESQIENIWKNKILQAQKNNQNLYNGLGYRLNTIEVMKDKVKIELGIIDFKTFLCINEIPEYFDLGEEYHKNYCHNLATVKTKDDYYIMVNLSGKSINENKFDFIGGAMETDIKIDSGYQLFESFYKELKEEAFVEKNDIKESYLRIIYSNPKTNIGFYFEIVLAQTKDELINKFNSREKDPDIHSLKFFKRDDYIKTLEEFNINKKFISTIVEI